MRVPRLAWCDAPTHVAAVVTECCFHVAFLCLKLAHVEGADRAIEAFQLQFANWLGADNWFSGDLHASIDKDLSVCGSRAQPGRKVYDLAVCRVVTPSLVTDAA